MGAEPGQDAGKTPFWVKRTENIVNKSLRKRDDQVNLIFEVIKAIIQVAQPQHDDDCRRYGPGPHNVYFTQCEIRKALGTKAPGLHWILDTLTIAGVLSFCSSMPEGHRRPHYEMWTEQFNALKVLAAAGLRTHKGGPNNQYNYHDSFRGTGLLAAFCPRCHPTARRRMS